MMDRPPRTRPPATLASLAAELGMTFRVAFSDDVPRVAILASREPHCLTDILARRAAHEIDARPGHPFHLARIIPIVRKGVPASEDS